MENIILYPLKSKLIIAGKEFTQILSDALKNSSLKLCTNDVIVLAETPVAIAEGRIVRLDDIDPSDKAKLLSKNYSLDPRFAEVILQESDIIHGGVSYTLLCEKDGFLSENAGVDESNAPEGFVVLSPTCDYVETIRKNLEKQYNVKIGVIITDSRTIPLKRGVTGVATVVSGMEAISDERGKSDLYGRKLKMTFRSIADDLAAAAQLLIGESSEMVPAVLIRGADIQLTENPQNEAHMPADKCVYMGALKKYE